MKRLAALAIAILATGCATVERNWSRVGSTQQDFSMESAQCRAMQMSAPRTVTPGPVGSLVDSMNSEAIFLYCMEGKGWRLQ